jgi:hypothetical protein
MYVWFSLRDPRWDGHEQTKKQINAETSNKHHEFEEPNPRIINQWINGLNYEWLIQINRRKQEREQGLEPEQEKSHWYDTIYCWAKKHVSQSIRMMMLSFLTYWWISFRWPLNRNPRTQWRHHPISLGDFVILSKCHSVILSFRHSLVTFPNWMKSIFSSSIIFKPSIIAYWIISILTTKSIQSLRRCADFQHAILRGFWTVIITKYCLIYSNTFKLTWSASRKALIAKAIDINK